MCALYYDDANRFMIYTVVSGSDEAMKVANKLIDEKLAECVNILDNVLSVYWWNDQKHTGSEVALIIKGTPANKQRALDRLYQIHPYDEPRIECIK